MRKLILFTFAILLCIPAFSKQKIRVERVEPDSTKEEIITYRTKANHWSLSGHVGIGLLDGDQRQPWSAIFPRSAKQLNFGFNVEYTFNPRWGIYLEYLYNPYGGEAPYVNNLYNQWGYWSHTQYPFRGMNHEGTIGVSLNLLNLFSRCRPQIFNWYANVGLGVSLFKITEHVNLNNDSLHTLPLWTDKNNRGRSMSIPIGTTLEVNATRWLSVLLNVQYRIHFQDKYDGAIFGNQNDHTAYAGLGLRWKINSLSNRDRDHVRDMSMCQWEQTITDKLAKENAKRIDTLAGRVDYLDARFKALEPRVRMLEGDMDKLRDSDGDGVPDIYDKEPNTPRFTPVNQHGEAIGAPGSGRGVYPDGSYVPRPGGSGSGSAGGGGSYAPDGTWIPNNIVTTGPSAYGPGNVKFDTEGLSVYFATGKYDISAASHTILSTIARRLQAHPEYKVEIHAYCDEQGEKVGYENQKLSENRAKKVRDTLVKQYGVDASIILVVQGHGVLKGPTIDYLPNRRSDIIFVR